MVLLWKAVCSMHEPDKGIRNVGFSKMIHILFHSYCHCCSPKYIDQELCWHCLYKHPSYRHLNRPKRWLAHLLSINFNSHCKTKLDFCILGINQCNQYDKDKLNICSSTPSTTVDTLEKVLTFRTFIHSTTTFHETLGRATVWDTL